MPSRSGATGAYSRDGGVVQQFGPITAAAGGPSYHGRRSLAPLTRDRDSAPAAADNCIVGASPSENWSSFGLTTYMHGKTLVGVNTDQWFQHGTSAAAEPLAPPDFADRLITADKAGPIVNIAFDDLAAQRVSGRFVISSRVNRHRELRQVRMDQRRVDAGRLAPLPYQLVPGDSLRFPGRRRHPPLATSRTGTSWAADRRSFRAALRVHCIFNRNSGRRCGRRLYISCVCLMSTRHLWNVYDYDPCRRRTWNRRAPQATSAEATWISGTTARWNNHVGGVPRQAGEFAALHVRLRRCRLRPWRRRNGTAIAG